MTRKTLIIIIFFITTLLNIYFKGALAQEIKVIKEETSSLKEKIENSYDAYNFLTSTKEYKYIENENKKEKLIEENKQFKDDNLLLNKNNNFYKECIKSESKNLNKEFKDKKKKLLDDYKILIKNSTSTIEKNKILKDYKKSLIEINKDYLNQLKYIKEKCR
jgi:hypothetical protein